VAETLLQNLCEFEVVVGESGPGISDKNNDVGIGDCRHGLFEHGVTDDAVFGRIASGIHQAERSALPEPFGDVAVAGDAGSAVDNGGPLPEYAVEKG